MKRSRSSPEERVFGGAGREGDEPPKAARRSSSSTSPSADAKKLLQVCTNEDIPLKERAEYLFQHPSNTWAKNDVEREKIYRKIFEVDSLLAYIATAADLHTAAFLRDVPLPIILENDPDYVIHSLNHKPLSMSRYFAIPGVMSQILGNTARANKSLPFSIGQALLSNSTVLTTFLDTAPAGTADRLLVRGLPIITRAAQAANYSAVKTLLEHGANALPGMGSPPLLNLPAKASLKFASDKTLERDYDKLKALLVAAGEEERGNPRRAEVVEAFREREKRRESAEAKEEAAQEAEALRKMQNAEARARSAEAKAAREAAAEAAARQARKVQKAAARGDSAADCPSRGLHPQKKGPGAPSFRKQSFIFHPDRNPGCLAKSTRKFQQLQAFFAALPVTK
jgi:hypothetical protein